jgi:ribosomal protein S18 acetylase RimI-like enzyme
VKEQTWSLRPAELADAAGLQCNCFPEQSLAEVKEYLRWCLKQAEKGRMVRLVAELDGQVVASGQLAIHRREGEIGSLVVAPACRRRGIGAALLRALIAEAGARQVLALEIAARSDVCWLRAWYRRLGFVPCEERVLPGDERVTVLRRPLPAAGPAAMDPATVGTRSLRLPLDRKSS